jgi:predicted nucleic acid-binding Zn finger protein
MQFCSCSGFYFGMIKSKKPCYHIDSVKIAQEKKQYEIIEFSDDEFENFMLSIVNDL